MRPNCQSSNLVTIVCYSVVDKDSFHNVKSFWLPMVRNINPHLPIVLVATHSDLRCENNPDHVTEEEGRNLCNELNMASFVECSAVQKMGISRLFEIVAGLSLRLSLQDKKNKTNPTKHGRWSPFLWTVATSVQSCHSFCILAGPIVSPHRLCSHCVIQTSLLYLTPSN